MPRVRGSKQHKMIVVPYRPALLWWVGAACALLLGLAASLGYFLGRPSSNPLILSSAATPVDAAATSSENAALKQQLLSLEQSSAVDKQALASVQETLVTQRETIAQLQEDLLFYKQIAEPENTEAAEGLVIGQFDLSATKNPQRLRYKIELRQQGGSDKLSGHANVNVLGEQDGERMSLPLQKLSTKELELDIPLGFRYFQNIEGELELPAGFTPLRVEVAAETEGDKPMSAQKSFGWTPRN